MDVFLSSAIFTYLFIFFARIGDVSINTIRIVFVSRGMKTQATILGFFESLIWLIAVGIIMRNLSDIGSYIAYAGGFAAGNYVGMMIEKRLMIGNLIFRILAYKDSTTLQERLRALGATVIALPAEAGYGSKTLIFVITKRREMNHTISIIKECNPNAIYSIEDMRLVSESSFPGMGSEARKRRGVLNRK